MIHFSALSRTHCRRILSALTVSLMLGNAAGALADEIVIDNSPDTDDMMVMGTETPEDLSGGALIEDTGNSSEGVVGLTIDELESESAPDAELIDEITLTPADPERIKAHLEALLETADPTGSEEELSMASYIGEQMKALGYTVQQQPFHEGFVNINGIDAPGVNLIAERGADSQESRTRDIFLIVTHYDSMTLPQADPAAGEKIPYANDKSGAVVLLETARILSQVETDTDLCFLFLSGQEDGGYGARAFISSLSDENRGRIRGVLAVDRVGYDTGMPSILKTQTGEVNQIAALVRENGLWQEAGLILDGLSTLPEEDADLAAEESLLIGDTALAGDTALSGDTALAGDTALSGDTALAGDTALSGDSALSGDGVTEDGILPETEEEPAGSVEIPALWSCLADPFVVSEDADPVLDPDLNSIQSIFADAGFLSAQITQYDQERDLELYLKTKELGLADSAAQDLRDLYMARQQDGIYNTADTFNNAQILGLEESTLGAGSSEGSEALSETETETEDGLSLPQADPVLLARCADVTAQTLAYIMDTE